MTCFRNLWIALPLFLAVPALAGTAPEPSCGPGLVASIQDRLDLSARAGQQRFPEKFASGLPKSLLINEFAEDGRPILVVTDATMRQKSGVVTVMNVVKAEFEKLTGGRAKLEYLMPDSFRTFKARYQDLEVPLITQSKFDEYFAALLREKDPQAIHIMVEGRLGELARSYLLRHQIPFTTAYHSMFPEFAADTVPTIPKVLAVEVAHQFGKLAVKLASLVGPETAARTQMVADQGVKAADAAGAAISKLMAPALKPLQEPVRRMVNQKMVEFHAPSEGILVPTEYIGKNRTENGQNPAQIRYWSHGVDTVLFNPDHPPTGVYGDLPRPISLFVGRVAVEKNIEDFLKMDIPGTKVIIGGGPEEADLARKYPEHTAFLGRKDHDRDLPAYFREADLFVFPSLTDTFGLVQLEAMASGTPSIGYRVPGPADVVTSPRAGALSDYDPRLGDGNVKALTQAWHQAYQLDRQGVREFAEEHTWERSTLEFMYFLSHLQRGQATR